MKSYFKKEEKLFPIKGTEHFYVYRWFFIPFLIVWLHNFEVLTYGGGMDGPTNYFLLLISSILCLQVYLLTIRTGPKWQQYFYKIGLFLVSVNILLGFFTIHSKREGVRFTQQDQKNIHRKDKHYLTGLKLLDTNNAYVVGKFSKRIYPLVNLYFVENHELTVDQQFKKYENLLLPNDFETYWKLIDTTSKNTSERLIGDYYGWQYFDYDIYILIDDCQKLNFPERIIEDDLGEPIRECFLSYTEDVIPRNFESIGYVFKASGGWPVFRERLQKFRLAINEVFFPVYAREDLINDPYFLIEKKKFKEAKAGLSNLPEERRLFCEAKLKALDKW